MLGSKLTLNLENFEEEIKKRKGLKVNDTVLQLQRIIKEGWENLDICKGSMMSQEDIDREVDRLHDLELWMWLLIKHSKS